jgi:hypothetical protein
VHASDGQVARKAPSGQGLEFDNHDAGLFVGPDGTVYLPVWAGMVSVSNT